MTDPADVAVVTVSYTARMDFLARQAAALAGDPAVREWIVVANGNAAVVEAAAPGFARRPRISALTSNTGSATGFGLGITAALADPGNRHVLLLDEDNLPGPAAAGELRAVLAGERGDGVPGKLAIAAYRHRVHAAQAQGIDIRRPDSSIGFHVTDLPQKLLRRLLRSTPPLRRMRIAMTAYGGLFFERELIDAIGLPLPEFVLYGDDTEFTLRIAAAGGAILLDPAIPILEMDEPDSRQTQFSLLRWLSIADEFRLYYGARNEAWLDVHRFARRPGRYALNRGIVRLIFRAGARTAEQRRRLALFAAAASEGEAGRLGPNPRYPLPGIGP